MAHLLSRQLVREEETTRHSFSLTLLRQALDCLPDGVLIVDPKGSLLFANTTWGQWTGYAREELSDCQAPFPFWVGQAELSALGEAARASLPETAHGGEPAGSAENGPRGYLLPFRRRNRSLFWCQVETTSVEVGGRAVMIAFLRQVPILPWAVHAGPATATPPPGPTLPRATAPASRPSPSGAETLRLSELAHGMVSFRQAEEMALLVRPEGSLEWWDKRWEELTGLNRRDLAGVSTELLLDWLFPHQSQRSFVADLLHEPERAGAQALLEVAARTGNCPLLCTFLPLRTANFRGDRLRLGRGTDYPAAESRSSIVHAWLILARPPGASATEKNRRRMFRKSSVFARSRFFHR
jgi:PAS domain-containing protein